MGPLIQAVESAERSFILPFCQQIRRDLSRRLKRWKSPPISLTVWMLFAKYNCIVRQTLRAQCGGLTTRPVSLAESAALIRLSHRLALAAGCGVARRCRGMASNQLHPSPLGPVCGGWGGSRRWRASRIGRWMGGLHRNISNWYELTERQAQISCNNLCLLAPTRSAFPATSAHTGRRNSRLCFQARLCWALLARKTLGHM
jgi:hypothetical protein